MKRFISILVVLSIVITVISASALGTAVDAIPESTLKLVLDNEYKFGFIAAGSDGSAPTIGTGSETALSEFILEKKGYAINTSNYLQLDDTKNIFYFFYEAYTNQSLKIQISTPYPLSKEDEPSQTITFKATLATVSSKWDGADLSKTELVSGSASDSVSYAAIKRDGVTEDFNYSGLCKVTITTDENLGEKKPGNYTANIYLILTNT